MGRALGGVLLGLVGVVAEGAEADDLLVEAQLEGGRDGPVVGSCVCWLKEGFRKVRKRYLMAPSHLLS